MIPARVLIRVTKYPRPARGELLALYVDSRTTTTEAEVVYSITRDVWRVEDHRSLMWRTRRATPFEVADARDALALIGEKVSVLQSAPRATDESPASTFTDT